MNLSLKPGVFVMYVTLEVQWMSFLFSPKPMKRARAHTASMSNRPSFRLWSPSTTMTFEKGLYDYLLELGCLRRRSRRIPILKPIWSLARGHLSAFSAPICCGCVPTRPNGLAGHGRTRPR